MEQKEERQEEKAATVPGHGSELPPGKDLVFLSLLPDHCGTSSEIV